MPSHSSPEVNIPTAEQSISCSQCEYKCTLDIDLKNHTQLKHKKETKYWCTECKFVTNYVANTWEHTLAEHPDSSFEFNPKQMDNVVLKLVAEQNADIVEEMESMKREIKDAFDQLSGLVETTLGSIKNDTHEKCKTLADAVMMLYKKTSKVKLRTKAKGNSKTRIKPVSDKIHKEKEKSLFPPSVPKPVRAKRSIRPSSSKASPTATPSAAKVSSSKPKQASYASVAASSVTKEHPEKKAAPLGSTPSTAKEQIKKKSAFLSKPKILYVADSVGHSASMSNLEISQNCR